MSLPKLLWFKIKEQWRANQMHNKKRMTFAFMSWLNYILYNPSYPFAASVISANTMILLDAQRGRQNKPDLCSLRRLQCHVLMLKQSCCLPLMQNSKTKCRFERIILWSSTWQTPMEYFVVLYAETASVNCERAEPNRNSMTDNEWIWSREWMLQRFKHLPADANST